MELSRYPCILTLSHSAIPALYHWSPSYNLNKPEGRFIKKESPTAGFHWADEYERWIRDIYSMGPAFYGVVFWAVSTVRVEYNMCGFAVSHRIVVWKAFLGHLWIMLIVCAHGSWSNYRVFTWEQCPVCTTSVSASCYSQTLLSLDNLHYAT